MNNLNIPEVTSIGDGAFSRNNLTEVKIPKKLYKELKKGNRLKIVFSNNCIDFVIK